VAPILVLLPVKYNRGAIPLFAKLTWFLFTIFSVFLKSTTCSFMSSCESRELILKQLKLYFALFLFTTNYKSNYVYRNISRALSLFLAEHVAMHLHLFCISPLLILTNASTVKLTDFATFWTKTYESKSTFFVHVATFGGIFTLSISDFAILIVMQARIKHYDETRAGSVILI